MGEQLHFSMDGEFLTAIERDWFWNMDKPYKKCEELLLSCMMGGNEEEKRMFARTLSKAGKDLLVSMSLNLSMTMFMFVPSGRRLRSFNTGCWSIKFVRI